MAIKFPVSQTFEGFPGTQAGGTFYYWYEYSLPRASMGISSTVVKTCTEVAGVLWVRALMFSE